MFGSGSMTVVPNLFGTRDQFHGRQFFHGASDGEQWGAADEASLACPPLTSCCAAWFLTGHGPVPVCGLRVGDSCSDFHLFLAEIQSS